MSSPADGARWHHALTQYWWWGLPITLGTTLGVIWFYQWLVSLTVQDDVLGCVDRPRLASTADAALDGAVATVLKPGYRIGDRVLRYRDVAVWTLELAAPAGDAGRTGDDDPNE